MLARLRLNSQCRNIPLMLKTVIYVYLSLNYYYVDVMRLKNRIRIRQNGEKISLD